jgi:hypothetical protein
MVVVVLEWGKARMFTKENYINANDRLTGVGRLMGGAVNRGRGAGCDARKHGEAKFGHYHLSQYLIRTERQQFSLPGI